MKSIISIAFLLQAIINAVNLVTAQFPTDPAFRCRDTGNYTPSSDYSRNLKAALDAVGNMNKYNGGSFSASQGKKETAYVMALCSGVSMNWGGNCKDCIYQLTTSLAVTCKLQKEAVMWGSNCMLHYSDRKISGVLDDWVRILLPDKKGSLANKPDQFDKALSDLTKKLQGLAAEGTDKKSALGTAVYEKKLVYGAMQCTADLSKDLCTKCLQNIIEAHHTCCSGRMAARMLLPNCFFSYSGEHYSKWKS
ncbi:hypothetical protein Lser_V15G32124 [Lactuca serriola]